MELVLTRFAEIDGRTTLGLLEFSDGLTLVTIERPWLDNQPFMSCIPDGEYVLEWDTTGRIKNVPRLRDVPGRSQINIHTANYANELHGCIAPGMSYDRDKKGAWRVHKSKTAMGLLLEALKIKKYRNGWGYKGMERAHPDLGLKDQDPLMQDDEVVKIKVQSFQRVLRTATT